jgi:membrane protease YdiL (CAAX protease family)
MVDVTGYPFSYLVLIAGLLAVRLLSKTKYAPSAVPLRVPRKLEIICLVGLVFTFPGALLIIYAYAPTAFWNQLPAHSFTVLADVALLIAPTIVFVALSKSGLPSVRLGASTLGFGLVAGGSASLLILIPTAVVAPAFASKFLNQNAFLISAIEVFSAFSEELFYRGLLQTRFEAFFGPMRGLVLAALCFGLGHIPGRLLVLKFSPVTAVVVFVLDLPRFLLFGYIAQKSNNVLSSTLVHISSDLPILLLTAYGAY